VFDLQGLTGVAKQVGAVAAAVVGEQGAHREAMPGEELARIVEEADGGLRFLVRQQLNKSHAGVVIDSHMEGQQAGMRTLAAQPSIAAQGDLGEAGHALDVQVDKVSRSGMLVAHDGRMVETQCEYSLSRTTRMSPLSFVTD